MNLKSRIGSTYIEIIISLFIIGMISVVFISALNLTLGTLKTSTDRYALIHQSEETMAAIKDEIKNKASTEMTDEAMEYLNVKYSSNEIKAEIFSKPANPGAYDIYVSYRVKDYNEQDRLYTRVYLE
ncbi:hypothetical protein [Alkalibacter mobilis]|uniref:hypothetical protein n=1 Tax=Alkalibacter mobilis TaxID=2787712 RepID=UPI00189D6F88|nr:hypothetical protein [Alkalibacter mobilis]MBF7095756.1 hypothetical protein [Alkalibacter mobilis]